MAPPEPPAGSGNGSLEQLLRDRYGEGRGGRPNTRAAAADLGVDIRQVQRWLKAEREGGQVTQSLAAERLRGAQTPAGGARPAAGTGGPPRASGGPAAGPAPLTPRQRADKAVADAARAAAGGFDLEAELRARYGQGPKGGVNTTAAGADLGVSPSTIRGWLARARQGKPLPPRSQAIDQLQQDTGKAQLRQRGVRMRLTGRIRVSADVRARTIDYTFTGDEIGDYFDRLSAGDPYALEDWLSDIYTGADTAIEGLDDLNFDPLP
jgi:transposase